MLRNFIRVQELLKMFACNTIDNKIDDWNKESFDIHKSFEYMIPSFIDLQIYGAKNSLLMVEPKEETIKRFIITILKVVLFFSNLQLHQNQKV